MISVRITVIPVTNKVTPTSRRKSVKVKLPMILSMATAAPDLGLPIAYTFTTTQRGKMNN